MTHSFRIHLHALLVMLACVTSSSLLAQENWRATAGPYGGAVFDAAMIGDSGVVASTDLYRTTDGGASWQLNQHGLFTSCLADDDGMLWATQLLRRPLAFSTNHGTTWAMEQRGGPVLNVAQLISAGKNRRYRLTVNKTTSSLGMQIDSGDPSKGLTTLITRQFLNAPTNYDSLAGRASYAFLLNPQSRTLFLAVADSTHEATIILQSTDEGDHWQPISRTGIADSQRTTLSSAALNLVGGGILFSSTFQLVDGEYHYVNYRSNNDGATWSRVGDGLPDYADLVSVIRTADHSLLATVHTGSPSTGIFTVPYMSSDDGTTWAPSSGAGLFGQGLRHLVITSSGLIFGSLATGVQFSTGGGLYRSTNNGASWELSVSGMNAALTTDVCVDSAGHVFAAVSESGIYRSMDHGSSWTRLTNGLPGFGFFHTVAAPDDRMYVADSVSGMYRSADGGDTWISITNGLPTVNIRQLCVASDGSLVAGTANGVFVSTNHGDAWHAAAGSIPSSIRVADMRALPQGVMLAATDEGPYVSTDNGNNWLLQTSGLMVPKTFSAGYGADGTMLIAVEDGVYRWSSTSNKWVQSNTGMPSNGPQVGPVECFAIRRSGRIIVARVSRNSPTIYASNDNGLTWSADNTGEFSKRPGIQVSSIAEGNDRRVYLGTVAGVWISDSGVTGVREFNPHPESFVVSISPNPVATNAAITIEHGEGPLHISIIDCLWREIIPRLVVDQTDAHAVVFFTDNLAPGMYRCLVRTEKGIESAPMCVIR